MEEKKIIENEANELVGCGVLIFLTCAGIALIVWAFTGFPAFWR